MPFPLDGKIKALYKMKRGFRLIFQAGGPAFLRSAALFPVVKCVEVYTCQIGRLTKAQNGSTQALKIQGGSASFFRNSPAARPGSFLRFPPLTLSPLNTLPAGKEQATLRSEPAGNQVLGNSQERLTIKSQGIEWKKGMVKKSIGNRAAGKPYN